MMASAVAGTPAGPAGWRIRLRSWRLRRRDRDLRRGARPARRSRGIGQGAAQHPRIGDGRSPSVKATAPASFKQADLGHRLRPARPLVRAAIGGRCTFAVSRARRRMKSTSDGSSITGSVLGMQIMVVTPPAAAAWLADSKVSRCSVPGSPVKTPHVDQAGREHQAGAIDDVGSLGHAGGADAALQVADHAVGDQDIAGPVEVAGRIDQPRVGEERSGGGRSACVLASRVRQCERAHPAPPCARPRPSPPVPGSG